MCVAEYMVPRIILRLIQHLRISVPSNAQMDPEEQLQNCEQVGFDFLYRTGANNSRTFCINCTHLETTEN